MMNWLEFRVWIVISWVFLKSNAVSLLICLSIQCLFSLDAQFLLLIKTITASDSDHK